MVRRLRRIALRILLVVVILFVVGLAAFTWFAFWPFERDVENVAGLVPANVDFVYRTTWADLKKSGWIQRNVVPDPLIPLPEIEEGVDELERILEELRLQEQQIDEQIPLGITDFSVEEDLVPGEIVAAGKFCSGQGPEQGPPTWREILLLTRTSWKPKLFSALDHGFVRERIIASSGPSRTGQGQALWIEELEGDVYKFVLNDVAVTPVRQRSGCGPGIVRPPENVWYGTRVRDVLAFSNAEGLIRGVRELAEFPDSGRSYLDRPYIELEAPPTGIAASLDVQPLENYLVRSLEMAGPPVTILRRYVTIPALTRLNGHLDLPAADRLMGQARIRYQPGSLAPGVADVYALRPEPVEGGIAMLVPAQDTLAALLLKSPARHLMAGIYEDILSPADRRLWNENLRRLGRYQDIGEFFDEVSASLGDSAGIAIGRISEVFDEVDYGSFITDPITQPDPNWPALAMLVRLAQGTSPAELDAFLRDRIPLLGASPDLEKVEYRGLTYTRVRLEHETADLALVKPAYILVQDHFVFSSNESYFQRILDCIVDPEGSPPLARDDTFLATAAKLPREAQVAFFVDLEKLFRVPPTSEPGSQPRGFLWDRRNMWVFRNRNWRQGAIEERQRLLGALGRQPTLQQELAIEEQVTDFVRRWRGRYPEFVEEYRQKLAAFGRLRSLGVAFTADRSVIDGRFVLLVDPRD